MRINLLRYLRWLLTCSMGFSWAVQMQASFSALPWIYFGCQWKHVRTAKSCTRQQLHVVLNMLQTHLRWKIASSMLFMKKP
jgi:hypothetical protein